MTTDAGLGPLRPRLMALLDEYDHAVRGTSDALLAAYLRAAVSALDGLHLKVSRASRIRNGGNEPGPHRRPTIGRSREPVPMAPMYRTDLRPEVTARLARERSAAFERSAS